MTHVLSQRELDRLAPDSAVGVSRAQPGPVPSVTRYDFRRPDRISKEQIHSLHFLHERFARNVSTSLAAYLRSMTELSLVSVQQIAYSEFLTALPDPTAYYALSIAPFEELGGLEINPAVAFALVERMLGGSGQPTEVTRALTDIEQNVIDSVVKILLDSLSETWRPIVDLAFGIRGRETRPQMLQVASPNDTVLMLVFDMRVGEVQGLLNFCLPASIVEKTDTHFAAAWDRHKRDLTPKERGWLIENLGRVRMPFSAVLGSRCSAGDLVALQAGDIVSLDVPLHQPVDARVGDTVKFRGRLTALSGRTHVQIEHRCDGAGAAEV